MTVQGASHSAWARQGLRLLQQVSAPVTHGIALRDRSSVLTALCQQLQSALERNGGAVRLSRDETREEAVRSGLLVVKPRPTPAEARGQSVGEREVLYGLALFDSERWQAYLHDEPCMTAALAAGGHSATGEP